MVEYLILWLHYDKIKLLRRWRTSMETFEDFLTKIDVPENQKRTEEVLTWIAEEFDQLNQEIKWNQPMFTDHGTYIIGFSVAKKHLAVAPEKVAITHFKDEIKKAGFEHTEQLIRMPWNKPIDFELLKKIVVFNIEDKKECTTFWRA